MLARGGRPGNELEGRFAKGADSNAISGSRSTSINALDKSERRPVTSSIEGRLIPTHDEGEGGTPPGTTETSTVAVPRERNSPSRCARPRDGEDDEECEGPPPMAAAMAAKWPGVKAGKSSDIGG